MRVKKNILLLLFISLSILSIHWIADNRIRIFLIGDSTMANKPVEDNPERGWGQVFGNFFKDSVMIENHAKNGRSTKSFIKEGLWQKVYEKLNPGDYVFIQFGHNDSKKADTNRFADANTLYRENLQRFIDDSRSKGAIPILITPVNRRKFNSSGSFIDQHGEYPGVVRDLAKINNITLLDLHKKSLDVFSKMGPEETKKVFLWVAPKQYKLFPDGKQDNTHFTQFGAELVAGMVVDCIKATNIPIAKLLK
jgi:DNA sulfur modification protein DndE